MTECSQNATQLILYDPINKTLNKKTASFWDLDEKCLLSKEGIEKYNKIYDSPYKPIDKVDFTKTCNQDDLLFPEEKNVVYQKSDDTTQFYTSLKYRKGESMCKEETQNKEFSGNYFKQNCTKDDLEEIDYCMYDSKNSKKFKHAKINTVKEFHYCKMTEEQKKPIIVKNQKGEDVSCKNVKKDGKFQFQDMTIEKTNYLPIPGTDVVAPIYSVTSLPWNLNNNELSQIDAQFEKYEQTIDAQTVNNAKLWNKTSEKFDAFNSINPNKKNTIVFGCPPCYNGTNDDHKLLKKPFRNDYNEKFGTEFLESVVQDKYIVEECKNLPKCEFKTLDKTKPYKKWEDLKNSCVDGQKIQSRAPNLVNMDPNDKVAKQILPQEKDLTRRVKCDDYRDLNFTAIVIVMVYAFLVYVKVF